MERKRINPDKDAQKWISIGRDKPGFEVRFINKTIGRGLFSTSSFWKGSFLLHYDGELVDSDEALKRASLSEEGNTFMFFFREHGQIMCIDATNSSSLARMVNDGVGKTANCVMKRKKINGKVALCLFALRDITMNEELRYDYGQKDLPWRKQPPSSRSGPAEEELRAKESQRTETVMGKGKGRRGTSRPDDAPRPAAEVDEESLQVDEESSDVFSLRTPSKLVKKGKGKGRRGTRRPDDAPQPAEEVDEESLDVDEESSDGFSLRTPAKRVKKGKGKGKGRHGTSRPNDAPQPAEEVDEESLQVDEESSDVFSLRTPSKRVKKGKGKGRRGTRRPDDAPQPAEEVDEESLDVDEESSDGFSLRTPAKRVKKGKGKGKGRHGTSRPNDAPQPAEEVDEESLDVDEESSDGFSLRTPAKRVKKGKGKGKGRHGTSRPNDAPQPAEEVDEESLRVDEESSDVFSLRTPSKRVKKGKGKGRRDTRRPDDAPQPAEEVDEESLDVDEESSDGFSLRTPAKRVKKGKGKGKGRHGTSRPNDAPQPAEEVDEESLDVDEESSDGFSLRTPAKRVKKGKGKGKGRHGTSRPNDAPQPAEEVDEESLRVDEESSDVFSLRTPSKRVKKGKGKGRRDTRRPDDAPQPAEEVDEESLDVDEESSDGFSLRTPAKRVKKGKGKGKGRHGTSRPNDAPQPAEEVDEESLRVDEESSDVFSLRTPSKRVKKGKGKGRRDTRRPDDAPQPAEEVDEESLDVDEESSDGFSLRTPAKRVKKGKGKGKGRHGTSRPNDAPQPAEEVDEESLRVDEESSDVFSLRTPSKRVKKGKGKGRRDTRRPDDAPQPAEEVDEESLDVDEESSDGFSLRTPAKRVKKGKGKGKGRHGTSRPNDAPQPAEEVDEESLRVDEESSDVFSLRTPSKRVKKGKGKGRRGTRRPDDAPQPAEEVDEESLDVDEESSDGFSLRTPAKRVKKGKGKGRRGTSRPDDAPQPAEEADEDSAEDGSITLPTKWVKKSLFVQLTRLNVDQVSQKYVESQDPPYGQMSSDGGSESSPNDGEGSKTSSDDSDVELKGAKRPVYVGGCSDPKRNGCLFCGKLLTKLSKHLFLCHGDEVEVAKLAALPKNSSQRSTGLDLLRNKGNFFHNKKILAAGRGEVIVVRRPEHAQRGKNYGPCPNCLGYYLKTDLWKHCHYSCPELKGMGKDRMSIKDIRNESALLEGLSPVSRLNEEVMKYMRQDKITLVIKNEELILTLGESILRKCVGMDPQKRRHYVAQKMRESARLLMQLRREKPHLTSLDEFITPRNFDAVVEAVRVTAGEGKEDDLEDLDGIIHPSLALKLGHNLKKLAGIKRVLALKREDNRRQKEATDFQALISEEWAAQISAPALTTMARRKFNKVQELPKAQDVQDFSCFLDSELKKISKRLAPCEKKSPLYRRCQHLVLAKLTTFNKRRPGEVEQLKLSEFLDRPDWSGEGIEGLKGILSPLEQKLTDELEMVYIRGKRGRKVPLLIPPNCLSAMEELVESRSAAGVADSCQYFFGRFGAKTPLRASDSLRLLTEEADLEKPHLIRTTKLRKYTATLVQVLNLADNQSEWLADHLGHSLQVHKQYYRLPNSIIEKSKIAKLLIAVDSGKAIDFIGKSLDEINFDEIPLDTEDLEEEGGEEETDSEEDTESQFTSGSEYEHQAGTSSASAAGKSTARKWKAWSAEDKELLFREFHTHIQKKRLPGKLELQKIMKAHPKNFKGRKWTNLKDAIRNFIDHL